MSSRRFSGSLKALQMMLLRELKTFDSGANTKITRRIPSIDLRATVSGTAMAIVYEGTVRTIKDFGAFVEILPGTDGMVHISELKHERVKKVTDVVHEGDKVRVKVVDIDNHGRIRLSRKAALGPGEE